MKNHILFLFGLTSIFLFHSSNSFAELKNIETGRLLFTTKDYGTYCVFEQDKIGNIRSVTEHAIDQSDLRKAMSMWPRSYTFLTLPFGFALGPAFTSSSQSIPMSYEGLGGILSVFTVFEFAERIGKSRRLDKLVSESRTKVSNVYYQKILGALFSLEKDSKQIKNTCYVNSNSSFLDRAWILK